MSQNTKKKKNVVSIIKFKKKKNYIIDFLVILMTYLLIHSFNRSLYIINKTKMTKMKLNCIS